MKEIYLIVTPETFEDVVFQHIVSESKEFYLKDVPQLINLISLLRLEHQKLYEIEFNNQTFTFTVLNFNKL